MGLLHRLWPLHHLVEPDELAGAFRLVLRPDLFHRQDAFAHRLEARLKKPCHNWPSPRRSIASLIFFVPLPPRKGCGQQLEAFREASCQRDSSVDQWRVRVLRLRRTAFSGGTL